MIRTIFPTGQAASDTELLAANARYEALVSAHKQALECEQKVWYETLLVIYRRFGRLVVRL